jgi:isoleucyl-tRNA synthetase
LEHLKKQVLGNSVAFLAALSAWFINIQIAKNFLVEQNNSVNWYPGHLKHGRFQKGIEGAPDWNISRNRFWATPLPFWKCQNEGCKNVHCFGSVAELAAHSTNFQTIYPKYTGKLTAEDDANVTVDLHRPYIDQLDVFCPKCRHKAVRVPEVVDCWVESGSMPFAELHFPFENQELFKNRFPSDFVVEYLPQTRAWFYVSHVISSMIFGKSPYKNVLTTGTILAEDGSKMSKSKANYPDPKIVLDKYGADALRFYLCASPVVRGEDISFSEQGVLEVQRKVNTLLLNSLSFYNLYSSEKISLESTPDQSHVLDKWMLSKLASLELEVSKSLEFYDTVPACKQIVSFIDDLSTWYIRRSRDRFKSGGASALQTFGYILARFSLVLAPFMPLLSEHIYRSLTTGESVHLEKWKNGEGLSVTEKLEVDMAKVREVVSLGLNIRKVENSPVRQPLNSLSYKIKDGSTLPVELEALILEELNVQSVDLSLQGSSSSLIKSASGAGEVLEVKLNLELNDQLKSEGLARELERAVQDVRKKAGLQIGQTVDLYYNTNSVELEEILLTKLDRSKTYLKFVGKDPEVDVDYESQLNVGNGALWIGLVL